MKNITSGLGSKLWRLSLRAIASMLRLQNSIIGSLVMSVGFCTFFSILTAKIYLLKQIRSKILSMTVFWAVNLWMGSFKPRLATKCSLRDWANLVLYICFLLVRLLTSCSNLWYDATISQNYSAKMSGAFHYHVSWHSSKLFSDHLVSKTLATCLNANHQGSLLSSQSMRSTRSMRRKGSSSDLNS